MPFSSESSSEIEDEFIDDKKLVSGADMQLFMQRRKEELQQEFKEQQLIINNQHGQLLEVHESVFLDHLAKSDRSVAHFYLDEFPPCRTLNKMLEELAKEHVECKFVKIQADDSSWFISKFKIKTLPSVIVCVGGNIVKKFIGLEEFGNEYPNMTDLKRALSAVGVITLKPNELKKQQSSILGHIDEDDSDF